MTERLYSRRNRWFTTVVAGTALLAILSAGVGFVALPLLQTDLRLPGIWDAICSAAGLVQRGPAAVTVAAGVQTSDVVVTPRMMGGLDASAVGRGATLALACTSCHGTRGLSKADSPNLAGQYAPAVYKQLRDYQSGARTNAVMGPRVAALSDRDMRDLAAYYAYLPRLPGYHPEVGSSAVPDVVVHGAPMRNIAPCATCHGGIDNKAGSAWLEGQSPVYLRAQLQAFVSGTRHNDISQQMRNVARGMTPTEIDQSAAYYSSRPGSLGQLE
jgi:cytochrome c553